VRWRDEAALTVVFAAEGYPASPKKGTVISGIESAEDENVQVFHAGTARDSEDRLVANGGRVLNVTAKGANVTEAAARAYAALDKISWEGGFCRRDIGWRAIEREKAAG